MHAGAGPDAGREERGGTARLDRALFELSSEDLSPRFVALVSEAKKRLLPGIARKTFNEARDQFRSGDREKAVAKFDVVLSLTETTGFKETADAEDLRTLASGFIDPAGARAAARVEPKAADPTSAESASPVAKAPEPTRPQRSPNWLLPLSARWTSFNPSRSARRFQRSHPELLEWATRLLLSKSRSA